MKKQKTDKTNFLIIETNKICACIFYLPYTNECFAKNNVGAKRNSKLAVDILTVH